MKANYLKRHITFFALFLLLAPALTSTVCKAVDLHYNNIEVLVDDIINKKHPNASFAHFAKALLELTKNNPKFSAFRTQLEKNMHSKNVNLIGLLFKQNQNLFPPKVRSKLISKSENELRAILTDLVSK